ncbi:hypothetical protein KY345_05455 [Candidatus Woesearchaeota archaeon]|nr:hypothetical protein [Candidatus Woesearchaeota archaeon]
MDYKKIAQTGVKGVYHVLSAPSKVMGYLLKDAKYVQIPVFRKRIAMLGVLGLVGLMADYGYRQENSVSYPMIEASKRIVKNAAAELSDHLTISIDTDCDGENDAAIFGYRIKEPAEKDTGYVQDSIVK